MMILSLNAPAFDPSDPTTGLGELFQAITTKNWWVVVAFAVTVIVWALRKWVAGRSWFATKWGGWALNLAINFMVVMIPFLASGEVTLSGFKDALIACLRAMAASGILWQFATDAGIAKKPAG